MKEELQAFLGEIESIDDLPPLYQRFGEVIQVYGFHAFTLGILPMGPGTRAQVQFVSTLSDELRQEYERRGVARFDPVITEMNQRYLPFTLKDIAHTFVTEEQKSWAELSRDYGVHNCFFVPLATADVQRGVVLFSTEPEPDFLRGLSENRHLLHLICAHFAGRAEQLGHRTRQKQEAVDLSPREIDCLQWAAYGRTGDEIAKEIGISERTVRFHITNACDKLGAERRSQAVARALALGLIQL